MSHSKNKLSWCLKKAEKELSESGKHRGLIMVKPSKEKAEEYLAKSEHYLKATDYLKKGNYSDISTSTVFYSMYHCLLAIAAKFGYESGNQECTFALISSLIEDKKIDFSQSLLDKIALMKEKDNEKTSLNIREQYQYGTSLSLEDEKLYTYLYSLAQEVLSVTRTIIEQR